MKFSLTYQGDLPATGNQKKPADVAKIRNCLHEQFVDLWDSHVILRELERTARVPRMTTWEEQSGPDPDYSKFEPEEYRGPIPPLEPGHVDLCSPLRGDGGTFVAYRPLVRKKLGLACALDILFLRQEEPGQLVLQSGDIDGRIKTLFDALRIPSKQEEDAAKREDIRLLAERSG